MTTVVESGADGMLRGTGQAVMRLETSLLSGMCYGAKVTKVTKLTMVIITSSG